MSDTCHMSFYVKLSDSEQFKTVARKYLLDGDDFDFDEEDVDINDVCLTIYAANYGFYSEIQDMTKDPTCPPFQYFQSTGDTYAAAHGVFFDRTHQSVNAVNDFPVVTVSPIGINCDELCLIYLYFELVDGFYAYCKEG